VVDLMLAARHLGLTALLRELGPEQVIELAAGLSPRGAEWARSHAGAYIEVDQAVVIAEKRRRLAGAPALGALHLVAADLRRGELGEAAFGLVRDVRTAVVSEGLTARSRGRTTEPRKIPHASPMTGACRCASRAGRRQQICASGTGRRRGARSSPAHGIAPALRGALRPASVTAR
jgi:hypothetical protein